MLRMDGLWHSLFWATSNRISIPPAFAGITTVPASWTINARAALRNIKIGGADVELAVWSRNLTQNRELTFALQQNAAFGAANYVPARTFGADLTVQF